MTTHYDILKKWIDSCETEPQLDNIGRFISDTLITDEKQRDDIIDCLHMAIKRRSWIAAKVANRDMVKVDRFPACDEHIDTDSAFEQFTDNIQH